MELTVEWKIILKVVIKFGLSLPLYVICPTGLGKLKISSKVETRKANSDGDDHLWRQIACEDQHDLSLLCFGSHADSDRSISERCERCFIFAHIL